MNIEKLKEQITLDEGRRNYIYSDLDGKPTWPGRDKGNATFGVGHKLITTDIEYSTWTKLQSGSKVTISDERIDEVFNADIDCCLKDCGKVFDDFDKMLEELQLILANMMFNMGKTHFLEFKNFILAVKSRNYLTAAVEMRNSKWWNDKATHNRAESLRKRMSKLSTLNLKAYG